MQLSEALMNLRATQSGVFVTCVAAALVSTASPAQTIRNHNSNAPVDFTADSLELQDRADRVVLSGGVTVTQAGLVLKANRLTAAYSNGGGGTDVERLDATGGVIITKDDLRATSNAAIYDLDSSLITLIGNVNLVQGSNKLNGGRLVIDLNSGRSTINGGGASGTNATGGRVSGTFTVPPRKN
jgi:lipopolysaccharide export system protein LptA